MRILTLVLLLGALAPAADEDEDEGATPGFAIRAAVTLPEEAFIEYGGAALLRFDLARDPADPDRPLPPCERVQLVAIAHNDRANFDRPVKEARLGFDPVCLECADESGTTLRVEGRIVGPGLRGSHMHVRMIDTHDRFGLHLSEGARGRAELNPEPGEHTSCFARLDDDATRDGEGRRR